MRCRGLFWLERSPHVAVWLAAFLILVALCGQRCAKKMLPPSPDRFAPRLEEVNARSRVQVELVFDEPVVPPAESDAESFVVLDRGGLPRKIRGVSRGRRRECLLVWTEALAPAQYTILGRVVDEAGNAAQFRRLFFAAKIVDTIAPTVRGIRPLPGSVGLRRDPTVEVTFSEPVDTSVAPSVLVVPRWLDTLFKRRWSPDWLSLSLRCLDSLADSEVVYIVLLPGVRDLSANLCWQTGYTYFASDSLMPAAAVRGRVRLDEGGIGVGVVFFDDGVTKAIAPVLSDGSFATRLRHGRYAVSCAVDLDLDGLAEFVSQGIEFNTQAESLELVPALLSSPVRIDAYCR